MLRIDSSSTDLLRDFSESPGAQGMPFVKGPERQTIGCFADSDVNKKRFVQQAPVRLCGLSFWISPRVMAAGLQLVDQFLADLGRFGCERLHAPG
jgi:hypothetical protein